MAPTTPMILPTNSMWRVGTRPIDDAMALSGVEIGSVMASEALNAIYIRATRRHLRMG